MSGYFCRVSSEVIYEIMRCLTDPPDYTMYTKAGRLKDKQYRLNNLLSLRLTNKELNSHATSIIFKQAHIEVTPAGAKRLEAILLWDLVGLMKAINFFVEDEEPVYPLWDEPPEEEEVPEEVPDEVLVAFEPLHRHLGNLTSVAKASFELQHDDFIAKCYQRLNLNMFNHIPGPIRELALVNFMSDRNYLPHPSDAFAAVSSLEIVMNDIFEFMTPEHWEPKYDDIWYSDVALAFFSVFKNSLRSLTLESYDECPIFSGHPFDMIFPHLEEIRLEHYPFVVVPNPTWLGLKTATLNSFLLAHKSTLKTLFLLNCPALFDDRWPFGSRVPSLSTVYDNLREELVELDVLKVRFHPLSVSFKEDKWVGERFEDFGAASTDIQRDLEAAVRWEAQVEQKRKSWL